jgi:glucose dehydrogenase
VAHVGRRSGRHRYAPLDQINAANFNTLQIAWRFKTDSLGGPPGFQHANHAVDDQRRALRDCRRAS